jgi:3,2-trans-enoyl-CoA isomerase
MTLTNINSVLARTLKRTLISPICCRTLTTTSSPPPLKEQFFIETKSNYAILSLNRAPVNSLNLDFLTSLNIQLDKLEENKSIDGVILTSNIPNIFSAGLDIMEMYKATPERASQFWRALQDVWIKLYGSSNILIAALNGHAPAGGCLLAMSCDYRIMSRGPYKIGLNETLLGITAPFWFKDTMLNTIGHRETEKALQLGKLYSAEEALSVNLVDELADPDKLLQQAEEQMKKWLQIPTMAREITKSQMRGETIRKLISQKEADVDRFVTFTMKDSIQKSLGLYLESLKKKK